MTMFASSAARRAARTSGVSTDAGEDAVADAIGIDARRPAASARTSRRLTDGGVASDEPGEEDVAEARTGRVYRDRRVEAPVRGARTDAARGAIARGIDTVIETVCRGVRESRRTEESAPRTTREARQLRVG